jgi:hypothetical protein
MRHFARKHDHRDVRVDAFCHLQRRERIEARQVVVRDHGVDASPGECLAHAGFVLDAYCTRPQSFAHQHREQQLVVEFGVLDDDQVQGRTGRVHGGVHCGGIEMNRVHAG